MKLNRGRSPSAKTAGGVFSRIFKVAVTLALGVGFEGAIGGPGSSIVVMPGCIGAELVILVIGNSFEIGRNADGSYTAGTL